MTAPAPTGCFSASYAEARAKFLQACGANGAEIVSHRHPLPGPDGAPLFLDEARVGSPDARRVLFVASGTHGIEGFCGSGIQTSLLRSGLAHRLPGGVAVVFVHAVNPWGFAWLRRVNEDNVDINRNFLDHTAAHPENPDYDTLYDALNPTQLDDAAVAAFIETVRRFEGERDSMAVYRALSGGQYRHARGVQYGGRAPVWSNHVLREVWARQARHAELAVFLDLHSGLGPRGVGMLLQTAPADSVAARLAQQWWNDTIRSEPAQGSDAALVSGLIGPAFVAAHHDAASIGIVLEFGTVDMNQVMLAVQADNWLHHHGRRDSDAGRAIAQRMRDAFFVADADWQAAVCTRAQAVMDDALTGAAVFAPEGAGGDATRVRLAELGDRNVLVDFARAMARETEDRDLDLETVRAGMTALLADPTRGRVFILESAGAPVATLSLTLEWSDWRNGFFWWIQSVYVSPAHRRRGHYRRLHEHVRALATREQAVFGLRLYVERENAAAQATYRALGMHETYYRLYEQATRQMA
jgi:ribosomal protein S18 acetylase RimI-like enzyme